MRPNFPGQLINFTGSQGYFPAGVGFCVVNWCHRENTDPVSQPCLRLEVEQRFGIQCTGSNPPPRYKFRFLGREDRRGGLFCGVNLGESFQGMDVQAKYSMKLIFIPTCG